VRSPLHSQTLSTRHLRLTLVSTAVPGVQRSYDAGQALNQDVIDARVWLGIHFRTAVVRGVQMGTEVATWTPDHYFQPSADSHAR
jgi:hypothetical protein